MKIRAGILLNLMAGIIFYISCNDPSDPLHPNPDPDPIDTTNSEPEDKLPFANVFYPQDTSKGVMYATKNNNPSKFVATCYCFSKLNQDTPTIYIGGVTSTDPWPRVYNYEIFGLGLYPLSDESFQIQPRYSGKYDLSYITVQHDTPESEYLLDTSYKKQLFQFTKIDTVNDRAEGKFNIQYRLFKIQDSVAAVNPPSIIRLANGRFWCKLQR